MKYFALLLLASSLTVSYGLEARRCRGGSDFGTVFGATALGSAVGSTVGTALGNAISSPRCNTREVTHVVVTEPAPSTVTVTRTSRIESTKRKYRSQLEELKARKNSLERKIQNLERELSDVEAEIEAVECTLEKLECREVRDTSTVCETTVCKTKPARLVEVAEVKVR